MHSVFLPTGFLAAQVSHDSPPPHAHTQQSHSPSLHACVGWGAMSGPLNLLDLFSGIGGFSLGLERTGGFRTRAFCEIDPFCRHVLTKHWPEVPRYDDIRTLTAEKLRADGISIDAICGGFPCQDISIGNTNNPRGLNGHRSGLWFEYVRLIDELRPMFALVENSPMLLRRGMDRLLGSLAEIGYDAEWDCIPACLAGAPIIRDRLWLLAFPVRAGWKGRVQHISAPSVQDAAPAIVGDTFARARRALDGDFSALRTGDGFSVTMERTRIHGLGNAVLPQIPEIIGRAILASMQLREAA